MLQHLLLICDFFVDLGDGLVIDLGDVLAVQHQCQVTFLAGACLQAEPINVGPLLRKRVTCRRKASFTSSFPSSAERRLKAILDAEPIMAPGPVEWMAPVTVPFRHLELTAAGAQPPIVAS